MKHSKDIQFVISINSDDEMGSREVEQCFERVEQLVAGQLAKITDSTFDVTINSLVGGLPRRGEKMTGEDLTDFREHIKKLAGVSSD